MSVILESLEKALILATTKDFSGFGSKWAEQLFASKMIAVSTIERLRPDNVGFHAIKAAHFGDGMATMSMSLIGRMTVVKFAISETRRAHCFQDHRTPVTSSVKVLLGPGLV
jgi:hypothetical protein